MSAKVMGLVWDVDLPQEEKFVLLAYADHADHEGGNIFPGIEKIAKKTGYSERSVQRIAARLRGKGYLVPVEALTGGRKRTNHYRIPLKGDKITPFIKGDVSVTLKRKRVTPVTQKGDIAMSPEPSITVNTKQPSVAPNGAPAAEKIKISNELRKYAQSVFQDATGLEPLPDTSKSNKSSNLARWWEPLRSICEIGQADRDYIRALIEGAVKDLSPDYISAPQSILNTIPKIKAKLNGSHKAAQPQYREVYK